jgi:hypothetical protein
MPMMPPGPAHSQRFCERPVIAGNPEQRVGVCWSRSRLLGSVDLVIGTEAPWKDKIYAIHVEERRSPAFLKCLVPLSRNGPLHVGA